MIPLKNIQWEWKVFLSYNINKQFQEQNTMVHITMNESFTANIKLELLQ